VAREALLMLLVIALGSDTDKIADHATMVRLSGMWRSRCWVP